MIYSIKQFPEKKFTDKQDQARFIKEKFSDILTIKKAEYKTKSEPLISNSIVKGFDPIIEDIQGNYIQVKAVINTTNVIDSHLDLHMKTIWNKTVQDNPYCPHLKQHEATFESIISKKAKSYNENMNFRDLGIDKDFDMVANINEFVLERSKMPVMFDAYKAGDVTEHSVGMMYYNIDLAYYDEESQKNMDFFNEHKEYAINPEVADEIGYFWVIREAKKREGSAVVFGSNPITPTLSVKNYEPNKITRKNEPLQNTQKNNYYGGLI